MMLLPKCWGSIREVQLSATSLRETTGCSALWYWGGLGLEWQADG